MLILPEVASAQQFKYNSIGDVLAGFRKTTNAGLNELVVDLGSVTNFLALPAGSTITISNYSTTQITNAFADTGGFDNLNWSAFSQFQINIGSWTTPVGAFPKNTIWYTLPATDVNTQTQPPSRLTGGEQSNIKSLINGVGEGAVTISSELQISNIDNDATVVVEPVSYYEAGEGTTLSVFIGNSASDGQPFNIGNFGSSGTPLPNVVENTTPSPFTSPQRDDFYQSVPIGAVDPITGLTTGNAYLVGYFVLNPDGSETFTRASASAPPSAGSIISSVTNGFSPLTVVFTNSASGTITNYVWSFGDGTSVTNTTGASVTNTYDGGGSYTVTLTVYGPSGSSTITVANFIVASPTPQISVARSGGNFVLSGTNDPAGVQYRILTSPTVTLPLASWQPVVTNTFTSGGTFSYTTSTTNTASFFQLVSP